MSSHEDSVREIPPQLTRRRSYAGQTLALDAVVVVGAGFASNRESAAWAGVAPLYVFGAPIVHLAHERPLASLASLALRVVVPVCGGALADSQRTEPNDRDSLGPTDEFVTGFFVGAAVAMLVDAMLLADEEVVVMPAPRPSHLPSR